MWHLALALHATHLPALLCFALLCFALLCFALLCFALLCFVQAHPAWGERPLHVVDVGGGKGLLAEHLARELGAAVVVCSSTSSTCSLSCYLPLTWYLLLA